MKQRSEGKSISKLSEIIMVAAAVLFIVLTVLIVRAVGQYNALIDLSERVKNCQAAAYDLDSASAYLTAQSRLYLMTGDAKYIENYQREVEETLRREQAVETLEENFASEEALTYLEEALEESDALMNEEYLAFRLAGEAWGMPQGSFMAPVLQVKLSEEDMALDAEAKKEKAFDLVSNEEYQSARETIQTKVADSLRELLQAQEEQQRARRSALSKDMMGIELLLIVLIALMIVWGISIQTMVINPLEIFMTAVRFETDIPVDGAKELRYLAKTYNAVRLGEDIAEKSEDLKEERDELTEVLNRTTFLRLRRLYAKLNVKDYALVLIDVDNFAEINNEFGYESGNRTLKEIAAQIRKNFPIPQYVCRIAEDEFAVLIEGYTEADQPKIMEALLSMKKDLKDLKGDKKSVTVSIGGAFAEHISEDEDVFKEADELLTKVKTEGKDQIRFTQAKA